MKVNVYQLDHLARKFTPAVEVRATLRFHLMTTRTKNAIVKQVRAGYIHTSRRHGSGLIASKLLDTTGVFYINAKAGRSRRKYLEWNQTELLPPGVLGELLKLHALDETATQVAGKSWNGKWRPHERFLAFDTIDLHYHVPPLLVDYVATSAYRSAVEPLIRAIETGGEVSIEVVRR